MVLSNVTTRDCTNLTLVGTGQGVLGTVGGVFICSTLVGRLEVTVLTLPGAFGTGGGVVIEVPQFPRPLTSTLLVKTVNLELVDGVTFEVLVSVCCEVVIFAHRTRLAIFDDPVSSFL